MLHILSLQKKFTKHSGIGHLLSAMACCDSWGRKELDTTERLI